ncbi:MAG: DUF4190 domain-containing protein [Phycisphaerales bacterium]
MTANEPSSSNHARGDGPDTDPGPEGGPGVEPVRSRLAVAGLILALVPCCPPIPLAGAMLGMLGLSRIRRSGGRLGGARLAIAAMLIGSVTPLMQVLLLQRMAGSWQVQESRAVAASIDGIFRDGADGWPDAALNQWVEPAQLTADEVRAAALRAEDWGQYRGCTALLSDPPQGDGIIRDWMIIAEFDGGTRRGVVRSVKRTVYGAGPMGILPGFEWRLRRLVLRADPDDPAGDLELGASIEGG